LDGDRNGLLSTDEIRNFQGFSKDPIQFTRIAWKRIFDELIIFDPFELDYRGFIRLILLLDDLNSIPENRNLIVDQQFHIIPHYHHSTSSGGVSSSSGGASSQASTPRNNGVSDKNKPSSKSFTSSNYNPYYQLSNGYNALKFFWKILTGSVPLQHDNQDMIASGRLTPMKIKLFYDDLNESLKVFYQLELPSFDIFLIEFYDLMGFPMNDVIETMNENDIGPTFQDLLQSNQCKLLVLMLLDVHTYWKYENREYIIANQMNDQQQEQQSQQVVEAPVEEVPPVKLPAPSPVAATLATSENKTASPSATTSPHGQDIHMTNYHYYSDDSYEEDSFEQYYSGEEEGTGGDGGEKKKRRKRKESTDKKNNGTEDKQSTRSLSFDEEDINEEEEIDQLEEIDKSLKNKFQNYPVAAKSNVTAFSSTQKTGKTAADLKDLLGKSNLNSLVTDDDDYDF
jgi:hypothetical protein